LAASALDEIQSDGARELVACASRRLHAMHERLRRRSGRLSREARSRRRIRLREQMGALASSRVSSQCQSVVRPWDIGAPGSVPFVDRLGGQAILEIGRLNWNDTSRTDASRQLLN